MSNWDHEMAKKLAFFNGRFTKLGPDHLYSFSIHNLNHQKKSLLEMGQDDFNKVLQFLYVMIFMS